MFHQNTHLCRSEWRRNKTTVADNVERVSSPCRLSMRDWESIKIGHGKLLIHPSCAINARPRQPASAAAAASATDAAIACQFRI